VPFISQCTALRFLDYFEHNNFWTWKVLQTFLYCVSISDIALMADFKPTIGILGHSFIHRLSTDITRNVFPRGFNLKQCATVQQGSGGFQVCRPGARREHTQWVKCNFSRVFGDFLLRHTPSVVILQLGENDLDSNSEPLVVASMIDEIVSLLQETYNVKIVMICELFPRKSPSSPPARYEANRRQLNSLLTTLFEVREGVTFWRHRRIFNAETDIFTADGVHLNVFGQQRFYRSLRHAIMTSVRLIDDS